MLGHIVHQARERRGLSKSALAEAVGCSSEYIRLIEAGERSPEPVMLERIVSALGLDAESAAQVAMAHPGGAVFARLLGVELADAA